MNVSDQRPRGSTCNEPWVAGRSKNWRPSSASVAVTADAFEVTRCFHRIAIGPSASFHPTIWKRRLHGERSRGDYAHEPTCVAQRSESQDHRSHVSDWRACVITYHLGAGWDVHSESTGADAVQRIATQDKHATISGETMADVKSSTAYLDAGQFGLERLDTHSKQTHQDHEGE